MKNKILLLCSLIIFLPKLLGQHQAPTFDQTISLKASPSFFVENKGQWPEMVLYQTSMGGMNAWITKEGIRFDFYKIESKIKDQKDGQSKPYTATTFGEEEHRQFGQVVMLNLQDAKEPTPRASKKQTTYYNYFKGKDTSKWASEVGLYEEILLEEIYKKIDLKYYFDKGYLRYDYIVKPGGDPQQVRFKMEGCTAYTINEKGALVFTTIFGEVQQKELELYQIVDNKRVIIPSAFVETPSGISFSVGSYDATKDLIIDPLIYSTFLGGPQPDIGNSIAIDQEKKSYTTGETQSFNFPSTPGVYDQGFGNFSDCFVSKFNETGTDLEFSTFIGADDNYDYGSELVLDSNNNIYVVGVSSSPSFPTTLGAFDETHGGGEDVFVLKLNATGTNLIYASYLGGATDDYTGSIVLDENHNLYIVGTTTSTNFPTTTGAYDQFLNGNDDVFVAKLNSTGTALVFATVLGGSNDDIGNSIVIDTSHNVYVTGETQSADLPVTDNAFESDKQGLKDIFVAKFNALGSNLEYASYIGGTENDVGMGIAIDATNNVYLTGYTFSDDFPVTSAAFATLYNWNPQFPAVILDTTWVDLCIEDSLIIHSIDTVNVSLTQDGYDAFALKLNLMDTALSYCSYLGGRRNDYGHDIVLDSANNVYLTGYTFSYDFPLSTMPFDATINGASDAFVARLDDTGNFLEYATYLGGDLYDTGQSICIDSNIDLYISGRAASFFPVTPTAYDTSYNNGTDAFVLKLGIEPSTYLKISCIEDMALVIPENQDSVMGFWNLPSAITNCDTGMNVVVTQIEGTAPGSMFGFGDHIISYDIQSDCGFRDTCSFTIFVSAEGAVNLVCPNDSIVYTGLEDEWPVSWDLPMITTTCLPSSGADPIFTQIEGLEPGASFPLGTHLITYTIEDQCGNLDTCSFNLSVQLGPIVGELSAGCLEDIVVDATPGASSSEVTWLLNPSSTTCNLSSFVTILQIEGLPPFADFPIGTNEVQYEISDMCGNIDTCSFNVIVNEVPLVGILTVDCLEDIIVDAPVGENYVSVSWEDPTAVSTCNLNTEVTVNQVSGMPSNSSFYIGDYVISYELKDNCNNIDTCDFLVKVQGDPVSVLDLNQAWDISLNLYPNPAQDVLQLEIATQRAQDVQLKIFAVDGRLVHSFETVLRTGNNQQLLPVDKFSSGLYLLQIRGEAIHKTKKFIKK